MPRPIGEDLVALVPSGAELLLDLDLVQLRTWDEVQRVLALVPQAGRARLDRLGANWMGEIDGLAMGGYSTEKGRGTLLVLRGDLDDAHLPALLDGEVQHRDLDGRTLYYAGGQAALRVGTRLIATGDEVEVVRVVDVLRGDEEGVRDASADARLRAALAKAPTAKVGRPMLLGAIIDGPLLQQRLTAAGIDGSAPRTAAFAVAVGDGVDAVLILTMETDDQATKLRDGIDRALRDLRASSFVRMLGIGRALEMVEVARDRDVRIAYRVSGDRLARALDRLDGAKRLMGAAPKAP